MSPDWSKFNAIPYERRISISKANLIDQCPAKYNFAYIDKIKEPPSDPIHQGNYFEWLIAGRKEADPCPALSAEKRDILDQRFAAYKEFISPEDALQIPIIKEIPGTAHGDDKLGNYHLIGFLDRQEHLTGTIIDHKVANKPWDIYKFTNNMRQAQGYVWATDNPDFRYDVINMETREIQRFPSDPTSLAIFNDWVSPGQIEQFVTWLQGIIRVLRSGSRKCIKGPLCNWCYYKKLDMCPAFK